MLHSYEEMAKRVVRSYGAIPRSGYPNSTQEEVLDAYLHFFSDAYQLKDWIINDNALSITKEEINQFIDGSSNMKLLQAIVTQDKHLKANHDHIKYREINLFWDDGSLRPSPAIGFEERGFLQSEDGGFLLNENGVKLELDSPKQEIHPRRLALEILIAWNRFFKDKKLKGSFIME